MKTYIIEDYIVSLAQSVKDLSDYANGGNGRDHILEAAKVVEKELHDRFAADNNGKDMSTGDLLALVWREKDLE